jgi:succinate dehydrogenase / fumarate reductase cytochrome b subunit
MNAAKAFFGSTIGQKVVMAVTGLILFGFVLGHMAGNLQVYAGPTKLDDYGALLRKMPAALWGARLLLLGSALAHVWAMLSLTKLNMDARPTGYRVETYKKSDYASRTMRLTGITLGAFIVYHILHLTTGTVHPNFVEGAVHNNFVHGFQVPLVSGFYIVAMLCLGLHLYHGVWSFTQTLGLAHPKYDMLRHAAATAFAALIVAGNISFPVAVLAGIVKPAPPQIASTATTAPAGALSTSGR